LKSLISPKYWFFMWFWSGTSIAIPFMHDHIENTLHCIRNVRYGEDASVGLAWANEYALFLAAARVDAHMIRVRHSGYDGESHAHYL